MHTESQWRYRAKRSGLRLVRYGQSLGYEAYGPYGLVDRATGRIVAVRLGPEDVERILFGTGTPVTSELLPTEPTDARSDRIG